MLGKNIETRARNELLIHPKVVVGEDGIGERTEKGKKKCFKLYSNRGKEI